MKTSVQKWGNSLALRIPKAFAAKAGLHEDVPVELTVIDGRIIIRLLPKRPLTLDELVAGITDQNLHGEWDTGPAVGRERW